MKKIKLYPSRIQRKILIEWFNTSRYVYNKVLHGIINENDKVNKFNLRNKYVSWNGGNEYIKAFEINTPKTIRQESVYDLCKAYKTCFSQLKSGLINKFNLNYKSKKNKIQSIGIERSGKLNKKNKTIELFKNCMGKDNYQFKIGKKQSKDRELQNLEIKMDCRICYDGYNFYFCIPIEVEKKENSLNDKIIALDPGTRTFSTGYDPDGNIIEFHRQDDLLKKLKCKLSLLQSKRKKRIKVVRQKIKNCVDELHWQTINYLTKNYKRILLPHFESQKMSMKSKNKHLNRDLNIFSHFTFKQRLYYKAKVNNTKVYDVYEDYTTKTCTNCGYLNDVKTKKEILCNNCNILIDRDYNGARNILLKHLDKIK
jgi:putative transposase